ncbi:MAG: DNA repair protein RecN [Streptococcaceae bacterium]|jgi:DNA repair protein RecN (Recombination protein N)|nr:DNA repair protein RecN [Streptococcaceae bacterium]
MLLELSIHNFAIIKTIAVHFNQGMTVLTGETGAGKSIIIDAMNLLLGARASADFIRHEEDKATIEGLFALENPKQIKNQLYMLGIDLDENQLLIKREIYRTGRSVCRINGHLVTLGNLKAVGAFLVDIHGQNEHQELMHKRNHLNMLDRFGNIHFKEKLADYQKTFNEYAKLHKVLLERRNNQAKFSARMQELKEQIAEVEASNLEIGEEELLKEKQLQLQNHQTISQHLINALNILQSEEYSPNDLLGRVSGELNALADFDQDYGKLSDKIFELTDEISELSARLENKLDVFEYQEVSLDDIEERLSLIERLERKYGFDVAEVLDYFEKISTEYEAMQMIENEDCDLIQQERDLKGQLVAKSTALNEARTKIARELKAAIEQEFKALYLEKAEFMVQFTAAKYSKYGNQAVEFFISMNPGEGFKPLNKTASGGELSRIMLALKAIFITNAKTAIVFDEVDTGVSGRVAQAIAEKIHKISEHSQVLCISHLPQVAAIADYQYFIEKKSSAGVTETQVDILDKEARIVEIARMLAGEVITPLTLEHAKEMLHFK